MVGFAQAASRAAGVNRGGVFRVNANYFNEHRKLLDRIDKKNRRILIRTGSYGRTTTRRSMRKAPQKTVAVTRTKRNGQVVTRRKRVKGFQSSPVGSPPFWRKGQLRNLTEYVVTPSGRGVVMGPIKLPSKAQTSKGTVPRVLEEGGTVYYRARGSSRRRTAPRSVGSRIEARPYIKPNFPKSLAFMKRIMKE